MTATPTATYTERYIVAATRSLPPQSREDLARELEASITDAILARTESGEPSAAAERDVLVAMGDPAKLAADYADRPLTLIGPRHFLDWWRLLKILLWTVLPLVAVTYPIVQVLVGATVGEIIGGTVAIVLSAGVHISFWTTLGFAILERTQPKAHPPLLPWSLDQLPELRPSGLGRSDMIASLVFLALTAAAVVWDRFIGFLFVRGEHIPVISPDLWPWTLVVLLPLLVIEGVFAVLLYRRGRWTRGYAVANTVVAIAVAVPIIWLVATGALVNPAFLEVITLGADVAPIAVAAITIAVAAIAAWDVIDGWYKVYRDRRV